MQVILLEKVGKMGNLGDQVTVKAGFGRNYLLPQGKAVAATDANIKQFEERRAELEKVASEKLAAAQERADKLAEVEITVAVKAGDEGKLYGSLGTRDLAELISEAGLAVDKAEVRLPEGPLRTTGEYEIALQLHSEVTATVHFNVVPEA